MSHSITNPQTENVKPTKRSFHFTEILMLKSIIALLLLTFFLLNEMQAESISPVQLNNQIDLSKVENTQP